MKLPSFFSSEKKMSSQRNFFEYSARDRKKIIKKASKEAIKKQRELVKEYNLLYCKA